MSRTLLLLSFFFVSLISLAQTSTISITLLEAETNEPLPAAAIYFEALEKGTVTNLEGVAILTDIPNGEQEINISYIGYQSIKTTILIDPEKEFVFTLEAEEDELEEVLVQSSRSTRTIKNIPTRIEFIGAEELSEKAVMNPNNIAMVLRESTGIQMQQTSLSSGNTNIRIQGLDGRYTQLLRDGFPLYNGFSSGLSILQIPPLDLQQFEIIKGSSSTLYGGGAIAGLVNMVSKTPDKEPSLEIMLNQTQAIGSTANIFYSKRNEKFGLSLYASGHMQEAYDPESDNFSNIPKTTSISLNPKFYYYPSENTTFWFGINGTYDDRIGGELSAIDNNETGDTETNLSKRISSQAVYETQLDATSSFKIKNSVSFFDRKLSATSIDFQGQQTNSFSEISYQKKLEDKEWVLGSNLYASNFVENSNTSLSRNQDDLTYGGFFNSIYDLSNHWILETGLRLDYNNDFGFIPLPRVSLLYKTDHGFSSRLGGGLGYKIPDMFTQESEFILYNNVLPIDKDLLNIERSYGFNFDVNYQRRLFDQIGFSINQLFYISSIDNGLLLNKRDDGFYVFENASDVIISKGAETNVKFRYKDFRWFLNYALIDTRLNYLDGNPQKTLTARHNAGSVFMYESEKWRVGYEIFYTGTQRLANGTETPDFITTGLLLMRNFDYSSVFINFENFTDTRQARLSSASIAPPNNSSFSEIYAPTDGFIFSVGVIIKPFGNEDED